MKKLYYLLIFIFTVSVVSAQEKLSKEEKERREKNIQSANPFAKYGYKAKVATLSNGKYLEVHDLDSIVTIGTIRWNVARQKIVGDIKIDTLNIDAQPIGDIAGRWISMDPLSEEFTNWSPYTFVNNNPLKFNDPTGMAPSDVIITGTQSAAALQELQKSVQGQLNLVMDQNGKVSYTQVGSGNLSVDAQKLTNAINDHSVTVNVAAENTKFTTTGQLYIGGAFMGNTVTPSANGNTVTANQEINPAVLGAMSTYYNKPGADTLHEVTEAYQGAVMSKASGVSSGVSGQPSSVYPQAHNAAAPQSGPVNQVVYDGNNNVVNQNANGSYPPTAVRAEFTVQQGNRPATVIQTIP